MAATETAYVDRGYNHKRKQDRMKKEEEEIKRLEAEARGEVVEEDEKQPEEVAQEETQPEEAAPISAEEKSFKKRYGDLRRHMQEKEDEWKKKFEELEARKGSGTVVPPKSDEDIEAWARKYPDVASIVNTIAQKQAKAMFDKADERLRKLDEMNYEASRNQAEAQIRKAHSDFDDLRESDDFHDWANEQPKWVQDALYENSDDPASVVRVIDLYKVDKGMTPSAKKEKQKAALTANPKSVTPSVAETGAKKIRESDVNKMSDKEYEANEEAILKAMREGNFIYDISGGAR